MRILDQDQAARALIQEAADHQEAVGGGSALQETLHRLLDAMLTAEQAGTNITHSQARTIIRETVGESLPDECREELAWALQELS